MNQDYEVVSENRPKYITAGGQGQRTAEGIERLHCAVETPSKGQERIVDPT
jgi:hypothetical protein